MSAIPKVMIVVAMIITALLYWATSNVCKYNFALEKRTSEINIVSAEVQPTLGLAKIYYYEELNCNAIELDWELERIIDNFNTLSVMIYQELSTDIRGDPN
jgi:hypothetical protein|tara:strand:+ start:281 stop:583 length:303 start_codon:yes stop_codon:yes gene_type:complete